MQLTASKAAIYAGGVCHRERMLRGMHRGLAAADLVSRKASMSSRDALTGAAEKLVRCLPALALCSVGALLLCVIIGGTAATSDHGSPGWGSVFFMAGAWQTLAVAIPVTLCVFVFCAVMYGFVVFCYLRFRTPKA
jgi:hypothetical protein